MIVEESILGKSLLHSIKDMQESETTQTHESSEEEDEEETLSLCDLPLYSDRSVEWDSQYGSTSISSSQDPTTYFEFFSQDLNPSTAAGGRDFPPENIIFCGRLIPPCKQPQITQLKDSSSSLSSSSPALDSKKKPIRKSLFKWKLSSSRGTTTLMQQSPKKTYNTNKHRKEKGFPNMEKMSIFTSSSSGKAKWYLLLFGISRLSTEVDIKSRRSCRRRSPSPPPMFGFENWENDEVIVRNEGWGLWGLMIRALSCGGNHQSTTTAIGCRPSRWEGLSLSE